MLQKSPWIVRSARCRQNATSGIPWSLSEQMNETEYDRDSGYASLSGQNQNVAFDPRTLERQEEHGDRAP